MLTSAKFQFFLLCAYILTIALVSCKPVISITKNTGIKVHYGRSAPIQPNNLVVKFEPKNAFCQITVLIEYPKASAIGSLLPSKFPCDFKKNSVFYQHYGNMNKLDDSVKLQVRVDTNDETVAETFIMKVNVVFNKPLEILNKVENLIVDELGGYSEPINSEVIDFNFDKKSDSCKVRMLPKNEGPPFYGSVVNTSDVSIVDFSDEQTNNGLTNYRYLSCEDFVNGNLRYAHQRTTKSTKRDYVPLVIEICDKITDEIKKREFFQMPVRIRRAPENERPLIIYDQASYSLQAHQLTLTALTPSVMKAEDRETDDGQIIFNITHQLTEDQGYFVNTDDPTRKITTFYQKDLKELKIAYKPPLKLSTKQRLQQIWFEARDNEGAPSTPFFIIVVIKAMNSYAPQLTKNTGVSMFEGQSRAITKEILEIRDPDNEDAVTITLMEGLYNGVFEKEGSIVNEFAISDIDKELVRYRHDHSDTYSDSAILKISDGKNELLVLFLVTIIPVDDEPPTLTYNTGLSLHEGGIKRIDQFDLSASDVDSDTTEMKFKIIESPKTGYLCYRLKSITEINGNEKNLWELKDGLFEKKISEFSHVDIILGKVYYRHNGNETFSDSFLFKVIDQANPPNESNLKTFIITIFPVDDQTPALRDGCPLEMIVNEGENIEFSKDVMEYTDNDSPNHKLIYKIIKEPYFENDNKVNTKNAGHIAFHHEINKQISSFTQKHVNHFKVLYIPPEEELGNVKQVVYFIFSVQDTVGNIIENQKFNINILPLNNNPPIPLVNSFPVNEGDKYIISSNNLYARDPDDDKEKLKLFLKHQPKHGAVFKDKIKLSIGDHFSLDDIDSKKLQYSHDDSESKEDVVKFILSDGLHQVDVHLPIDVLPVNDEKPKLDMMVKFIEVNEKSVAQITNDMFHATDTDTDDDDIVIVISGQPTFGRIKKRDIQIESFEIKDLKEHEIFYEHVGGEIGPTVVKDYVNFTVDDNSKRLSSNGDLHSGVSLTIKLMPVNSEPPIPSGNYFLQVEESKTATLTRQVLRITDKDTKLKDVLCSIKIKPDFGFVQTSSPLPGSEISRIGKPIKAFTAHDLNNGLVSYNQNNHERIEPRSDKFTVQCSDGVNKHSEITINIGIIPSNDEKPDLFISSDIMCVEDDIVLFDLSKINPFDFDNPQDELVMTLTKQPKFGELLLQNITNLLSAKTFTKDALSSDYDISLIYQHRGIDSKFDSFELGLSDGIHKTTKTVNISIIPVDDETPRLIKNTGLRIDRKESKVITSSNLKAIDLDSNDDSLMYIVMMTPILGSIQKRLSPSSFVTIGKGGNFTQEDIKNRRIRYTHKSDSSNERDVIRLDITDGFNRLINQRFHILITPMDNQVPDVVMSDVSLKENGLMYLTTDVLSASDLNTPDEKIQFVVTKTPLKGHLENLNARGIPIIRFSQLDLAARRIIYIHTSKDEVKFDNFEFEVTDGRNRVFRTFRIKVDSINNKLPIVKATNITVFKGKRLIITPFEIEAIDNDTASENIKFRITQRPKHGRILLNGNDETFLFTMKQIEENKVSYHHDGYELDPDKFSLTLTDGKNLKYFLASKLNEPTKKQIEIFINVREQSKDAPTLVVNKEGANIRDWKSNKILRFSPYKLKAKDADTPDDKVMFSIRRQPLHGMIVNVNKMERGLVKFSQADINSKKIIYLMNANTTATEDSFVFDVYDSKKNMLPDQLFSMDWAYVYPSHENQTFKETDGYAKVQFTRKGNLKKTVIATVEIVSLEKEDSFSFPKEKRYVQFSPRQEEAFMKIKIINNKLYEKSKRFMIRLLDVMNGMLSNERTTNITIVDPEDEPTIKIANSIYFVNESSGVFQLPLQRIGDVSGMTKVICQTIEDTARGTKNGEVLTGDDYISITKSSKNSIITFETNETTKFCEVQIIDDTLYEDDESFKIKISSFYGGKIHGADTVEVAINKDENDEPIISFVKANYTVNESDGTIVIGVQRKGSDLSMKSYVVIATKQTIPLSAKANVDYSTHVQTLEFDSNQKLALTKVTILDDSGNPKLEGNESFLVTLNFPRNVRLGNIVTSLITIQDEDSDAPRFEFAKKSIKVLENDGQLSIPVLRYGDLHRPSQVLCYTRQISAKAGEDFEERPKLNDSALKFHRHEWEKNCIVNLIDDATFEPTEKFNVVLENVETGRKIRMEIIVEDDDKPTVTLAEKRIHVVEPSVKEEESKITLPVVRTGDLSKTLFVTVFTKDGSAKSGINYKPFAKLLRFEKNETLKLVEITILHDPIESLHAAFTVNLFTEESDETFLGLKKSVIFIQEKKAKRGFTFPLNPIVISLMDINEANAALKKPIQGYPLVCLTACHEKHPEYKETRRLCEDENIDNDATEYKWQKSVSHVYGSETYQDISTELFFVSPNQVTLDSIYFSGGSKIRCITKAVSRDGLKGVESYSDIVVINPSLGLCLPKNSGDIVSQTFSAKVSYTSKKDKGYPNLVKLKVLIPHYDGLLPAVSTTKITDLQRTLSPDASRIANHKCSNLLDIFERKTRYGFIRGNDHYKNDEVDDSYPHQFDTKYRKNNTIRFYKNLDMDACLWTFESYFDMTELTQECNGEILTDGLVRDAVQSHIILKVPLHVSYIYYGVGDSNQWTAFDHHSHFQLTALYNTGILWKDGISVSDKGEAQGNLYPSKIMVRKKDKRLQVTFRTKPKFKGMFLQESRERDITAQVNTPNIPGLRFNLRLVRSQETFNRPEQIWEFTSNYAARDYAGQYHITLIPCIAVENAEYSDSPDCNPMSPVRFKLNITMQQTSEPVETTFTLDTKLLILNNKKDWLSGKQDETQLSEVAFGEDDPIYGKVVISQSQSIGSAYHVAVEKVYICSGVDGFIPSYNPKLAKFGCIADSPNLIHRARIMDRSNPETADKIFFEEPFNATFAEDDESATFLSKQATADGFVFQSRPLFKASAARTWFVHVIYSMKSKHGGVVRRDTSFVSLNDNNDVFSRQKRATADDISNIGETRGTNLRMLMLKRPSDEQNDPINEYSEKQDNNTDSNNTLVIAIVCVSSFFAIAIVIIIVIAVLRKPSVKFNTTDQGTEI